MKKTNLFFLTLPLLLVQACAGNEISQSKNSNTGNLVTSNETTKLTTEELKEEREAFYEKKRKELRSQSATLKADQAIREKKAYLMAIPGGKAGSLNVPGLNQSELNRLKCKTEMVEGFGDTIYGTNHLLYIKELRQFMLEFNIRMRLTCV